MIDYFKAQENGLPYLNEEDQLNYGRNWLYRIENLKASMYLENFAKRLSLKAKEVSPYLQFLNKDIAEFIYGSLNIFDEKVINLTELKDTNCVISAMSHFVNNQDYLIKEVLTKVVSEETKEMYVQDLLTDKLNRLFNYQSSNKEGDFFNHLHKYIYYEMVSADSFSNPKIKVSHEDFKLKFVLSFTDEIEVELEDSLMVNREVDVLRMEEMEFKEFILAHLPKVEAKIKQIIGEEVIKEVNAFGFSEPKKFAMLDRFSKDNFFIYNIKDQTFNLPLDFKSKNIPTIEDAIAILNKLQAYAPDFYKNQKTITFMPNEYVKDEKRGILGTNLTRANISELEMDFVFWQESLTRFLEKPETHMTKYETYSNSYAATSWSKRNKSEPRYMPSLFDRKAERRMTTYYELQELISAYSKDVRVGILEKVKVRLSVDHRPVVLYYLDGVKISSAKYYKLKRKYLADENANLNMSYYSLRRKQRFNIKNF